MDVFVKDLKVGDKVNCHGDGWLVVTKVDCWCKSIIAITYDNGIEMKYTPDEKLFIIR